MSRESSKFSREWLESKPDAIINYTNIARSLAEKILESKDKLISNWLDIMKTTKFEDRLSKYKDNELMGNAYKDGVNAKVGFSEQQLRKVRFSIEDQRFLMTQLQEFLFVAWQNNDTYRAYPKYPKIFHSRFNTEVRIGLNFVYLSRRNSINDFFDFDSAYDQYMIDNFSFNKGDINGNNSMSNRLQSELMDYVEEQKAKGVLG